jgi:hypothetical protein
MISNPNVLYPLTYWSKPIHKKDCIRRNRYTNPSYDLTSHMIGGQLITNSKNTPNDCGIAANARVNRTEATGVGKMRMIAHIPMRVISMISS